SRTIRTIARRYCLLAYAPTLSLMEQVSNDGPSLTSQFFLARYLARQGAPSLPRRDQFTCLQGKEVVLTFGEVTASHSPIPNSHACCKPSLSGDACISVICTLNLDININAVAELTSTLLFVQRWNLVKRESVL
ncbi:hypothetical protein BGY98DRAFT_1026122, partial [Russula aff. rugulosa BPL654]